MKLVDIQQLKIRHKFSLSVQRKTTLDHSTWSVSVVIRWYMHAAYHILVVNNKKEGGIYGLVYYLTIHTNALKRKKGKILNVSSLW